MNNLEIATIITSVLTPIAIAVLGYCFNQRLKQMDFEHHRRNKLLQEEKEQQQK